MLDYEMDGDAAVPLLNGMGFFFGLLGVVALFIQQSLTMFLPLMLPLVVCCVFCTLLIRSQKKSETDETIVTSSPVRIDVI